MTRKFVLSNHWFTGTFLQFSLSAHANQSLRINSDTVQREDVLKQAHELFLFRELLLALILDLSHSEPETAKKPFLKTWSHFKLK